MMQSTFTLRRAKAATRELIFKDLAKELDESFAKETKQLPVLQLFMNGTTEQEFLNIVFYGERLVRFIVYNILGLLLYLAIGIAEALVLNKQIITILTNNNSGTITNANVPTPTYWNLYAIIGLRASMLPFFAGTIGLLLIPCARRRTTLIELVQTLVAGLALLTQNCIEAIHYSNSYADFYSVEGSAIVVASVFLF